MLIQFVVERLTGSSRFLDALQNFQFLDHIFVLPRFINYTIIYYGPIIF